jgi:hypothetical protein
MRGRTFVLAGTCALAVAGCGGAERQDESEREGTYRVEVVEASFPESQRLARQETMEITVRNAGDRTIPNVSVTVEGFSSRSDQAGLADARRPVWIVDNGPRGGETSYVDTAALGELRANSQRTFTWRVTPVRPGSHEVKYRVNAGLHGKAKARLAGDRIPEGAFDVRVAREPPQARVNPDTGEVERN